MALERASLAWDGDRKGRGKKRVGMRVLESVGVGGGTFQLVNAQIIQPLLAVAMNWPHHFSVVHTMLREQSRLLPPYVEPLLNVWRNETT